MTEQGWLNCTDPTPMLDFIWGNACLRKRRLAAVACCRHVWHFLTDHLSRQAVELAEKAADGLATDEALAGVGEAYEEDVLPSGKDAPPPIWAVRCASLPSSPEHGLFGDPNCIFDGEGSFWSVLQAFDGDVSAVIAEKISQCQMLRDLFGNPFRPVSLDPSWLTSTVLALAHQMYETRDFSPMPILADALQDAGCDNDDILNHCRSDGPHVRGCWVVDLILGKE